MAVSAAATAADGGGGGGGDASEVVSLLAGESSTVDGDDDVVMEGVVDYKGEKILMNISKSTGGWRSASFIIGVEIAERFAYYGIASNLITYLTGPLGQSTAVAAENVNVWSGVSSMLPLLGAFVSDSYLGRFRTILFSSVLYVLGLGLLTMSVLLPLCPIDCKNTEKNMSCSSPSPLQVIFFFSSLYLVAIAQGGHKPCVQAFGADQFDGRDPEESKSKSSFFNWWYFGVYGGNAISLSILNYIQDNLNWGLGFGIPCVSMVIALVIFLLGTKSYRYSFTDDKRSPFVRIGQVFVVAARNWGATTPLVSDIEEEASQKTSFRAGSHQFKFLDKALISASDGSRYDQSVCSISQVEEAKVVLRLVPIWVTCLIYAVVFAQSSTFFTKQGNTMDRSIGPDFQIPAASLQTFIGLSIILFIPIYDRVFVPISRVVTAVIEKKRLQTALDFGLIESSEATVPMSVWWLAPQYVLFRLADVFTMVGLQEFFYDQVPDGFRSVGLSLYLSIFGIGYFLSGFLISTIDKVTSGSGQYSWFSNNLNRAHLDYFYWLLAGFSVIDFPKDWRLNLVIEWFGMAVEFDAAAAASGGGGAAANEIPLLAVERESVVEGVVDYKGRRVIDRSKTGGWRSASFIIGVEIAERFAYYGISSNLITYLTGPLRQSTAAAAQNVNYWSGINSMCPLLGAFVADSYLGRFRTILYSSLLYVLGLGLLTLSAMLPSLNPTDCKNTENNNSCSSPSPLQVILFFSSLYLVAIALGGHKPCVQAFGADQFDGRDQKEGKSKSSFFNWWFFGLCLGATVSFLILNYIQDNFSWGLGFGIPCISMAIALVIFLLGTKNYRYSFNDDKTASPFLRIARVFVAAAKNWRVNTPSIVDDIEGEGNQKTFSRVGAHQFKFLDKALIPMSDGDGFIHICTISEVEEAKAILRLVPIWVTSLIFTVVYAQSSTFFTKQGSTMDRSIGPWFQISAASLQTIISLSIILFIPIYDRVFVPIARFFTGKPAGITMLQRIGCGMFIYVISMVVAATVEKKRLQTARTFGLIDIPNATIPMSVWWLAPQYLLFGLAEVFTVVGLQEFFYDQVPEGLRSMGLSFYLSIFGIGSFLSGFLISIIETVTSGSGQYSWFSNNLNRAHLDYFYWLLAGLLIVELAAYLCFAKSYLYKK
ncbi:Proton-dependent oligopeptide transporter family [Macleaya cordata]|uniref:Proton-dependent oligopeptide transporter family n=1 Tax=Macleaya cordata TaxID=56857 RepID=A0A200Q428_MACCD|nr:Proton-dependent oligopeptide transporter family [Macleaya cordata]